MKKGLISILLFTVIVTCLYAQEVAEDEFLGTEPIDFINYQGPYDVINTLEQIKGIGEVLGRDIEPDRELTAVYGPYTIIHSYQPEITEGLDGDILIMGSGSQVDSVTNLRHIIAGYLISAYGYDEDRAFTLATFITYYNALWYQQIDHFSSRYKSDVISHLEANKCGLSRIWSDWPGSARIVIPLKAPGSTVGGIDTSTISEKEVVEVMQQEEDLRVDERKEMVEIREEENLQVEEEIAQKEETLTEKEEEVSTEIEKLEEKETPLTVDEKETLEELKEEKEELEEERVVLEEEKEELETKSAEVLDMRDDIAVDENKRIDQGDSEVEEKESVFVSPEEQSAIPVFLFVQKGVEEGYAYGTIQLYDLTTGKKENEATVTNIYGRSNLEYAGGFLAIAEDRTSGMVLPMIIDRENLAISAKGETEVFPGTQVVIDMSNLIYLIVQIDNKWYLGKLGKDLVLMATSSVEVNPMTDILFYNGKIFVQEPQGKIVVLNGESLESEKELE